MACSWSLTNPHTIHPMRPRERDAGRSGRMQAAAGRAAKVHAEEPARRRRQRSPIHPSSLPSSPWNRSALRWPLCAWGHPAVSHGRCTNACIQLQCGARLRCPIPPCPGRRPRRPLHRRRMRCTGSPGRGSRPSFSSRQRTSGRRRTSPTAPSQSASGKASP